MTELLQFQAHHWHSIMQKKYLENPEKHSPKDESVLGGGGGTKLLKIFFGFTENKKV